MQVKTFYVIDQQELQTIIARHIAQVNDLVYVEGTEITFKCDIEGKINATYEISI